MTPTALFCYVCAVARTMSVVNEKSQFPYFGGGGGGRGMLAPPLPARALLLKSATRSYFRYSMFIKQLTKEFHILKTLFSTLNETVD